MFDKLDFITDKYNELSAIVSDPEVIANQAVWQKHVKEMGEMEPRSTGRSKRASKKQRCCSMKPAPMKR